MVSVIVRIGYHREGVQTDKVKLAADREWEVRFQDRPHTLCPCVRFQLPPDIVRITSHMLRQQVAGVHAEIGKLVDDGLSCLTIPTSPLARRDAPSVDVTRRARGLACNTTASVGMRWPCGLTNRELYYSRRVSISAASAAGSCR